MCTKKVFSLAAEALEGTKNSYTREKPMVSFLFGQVKMTILLFLFLTMAWLRGNFLLAPTMLEVMSILIVEILRTEAKGWHLNRKKHAAKSILIWPLVIIWCWLKCTDIFTVATICNDSFWKFFISKHKNCLKLCLITHACSTALSGIRERAGQQGVNENEIERSAKYGPQNLQIYRWPHGTQDP